MENKGLFRSIINAVIQEEKKKYASKPFEIFYDQKKQHWYRIMNLMDELEAEAAEKETETPNP